MGTPRGMANACWGTEVGPQRSGGKHVRLRSCHLTDLYAFCCGASEVGVALSAGCHTRSVGPVYVRPIARYSNHDDSQAMGTPGKTFLMAREGTEV